MTPLFFVMLLCLYGAALVNAVPFPTTALPPRQVPVGVLPLDTTSASTTDAISSPNATPITIHTILGIPTISTTLTETSTTTNTVPSSTTTHTFTEHSGVSTSTSTSVLEQTIETTLPAQVTVTEPAPSAAVAISGNGAAGFVIWDRGSYTRLGWTAILGLLMVASPW